jgi:hypothetical protein
MITTILSLLLGASLTLPPSFVAPKGWIAKTPPVDAPIDFIWLAPNFGVNVNGENLAVWSHPVSAGDTLDAEVHGATDEMSQDRIIANSHTEPTCHGLQPGLTFEARLPLSNGKTISQVYHLTIVAGRTYAFVFTHAAGDPIDQAIADSIQSVCPDKPSS